MKIEELGVTDECINKLRRAGFTLVEEITQFLEQSVGTGVSVRIVWGGSCFNEVVDRLNLMRLLPEDF